MIPFTPEVSNRAGPRPSLLPYGGGECQKVVASDLSPTLRAILLDAPEGDFARFGHLKVARIFDSAIRRGFIEAAGYVASGQWQYRLTAFGRAVRGELR
jgi:hypothetical protein